MNYMVRQRSTRATLINLAFKRVKIMKPNNVGYDASIQIGAKETHSERETFSTENGIKKDDNYDDNDEQHQRPMLMIVTTNRKRWALGCDTRCTGVACTHTQLCTHHLVLHIKRKYD